MENLTLYRKYRPMKFSEIYGQEHVKISIKNAITHEKLSHAYLFNGPRGVGKTTIARLIARSINCLNNRNSEPCGNCENCISINEGNFPDLIEIDAASNRGIDEIRDLKEKAGYLPVKGFKKIYIIDEVHMLTKEAFNALLKLLEEPPKHIIFILATTEIEKIPDTVISRTQRFDFKTIKENDIINMLEFVANNEKINISKEGLELIFRKSEGSARDAFSIFEQVISNFLDVKEITLEMVEKSLGIVSKIENKKLLNYLISKDKKSIIEFIDKLWLDGVMLETFFKDFCNYVKDSEIDIDFKIRIISEILEILNKYKNEDNKRLLSFLIIDKLIETNFEKEVIKKEYVVEEIQKENFKNESFSENDWNLILNFLKLEGYHALFRILYNSKASLTSNKMSILLDKNSPSYSYNKSMLFSPKNVEILEEILKNKFNKKIKIEYNNEEDLIDTNLKNNIMKLFNAIEE